MSLSNIFTISGSAMSAQTIRLNTIASNMANVDSAASSADQTYRARKPVFSQMMNDSMREYGWNNANKDDTGAGVGVKVDGIVNRTHLYSLDTNQITQWQMKMVTCFIRT